MDGIIQYVAFSLWLISFGTMLVKFIVLSQFYHWSLEFSMWNATSTANRKQCSNNHVSPCFLWQLHLLTPPVPCFWPLWDYLWYFPIKVKCWLFDRLTERTILFPSTPPSILFHTPQNCERVISLAQRATVRNGQSRHTRLSSPEPHPECQDSTASPWFLRQQLSSQQLLAQSCSTPSLKLGLSTLWYDGCQ